MKNQADSDRSARLYGELDPILLHAFARNLHIRSKLGRGDITDRQVRPRVLGEEIMGRGERMDAA